MPRVITSLSFDLKFNVSDTPPQISCTFTDQDAAGRETHGSTRFVDAAASRVAAANGDILATIAAVNVEIDAQAADVREPGTVAARIQAVSEADAALVTKEASLAAKEAELTAKASQLADLDAQIAAKEAALAKP